MMMSEDYGECMKGDQRGNERGRESTLTERWRRSWKECEWRGLTVIDTAVRNSRKVWQVHWPHTNESLHDSNKQREQSYR